MDCRGHLTQENPLTRNDYGQHENGGHAGTAEAENAETMDLLTGMLDAATHCGDNGGDGKEPAKTAGTADIQDGNMQK